MPSEGAERMNDPPAGRRARGRPSLQVVPDLDASNRLRVHLGERLRLLRTQSGLTQEKAAGAAGITRNRLAELEKARFPNPTLNTLLRLMQVYGLESVEELLGPTPSFRLAAAWQEEGWDTSRKENSRLVSSCEASGEAAGGRLARGTSEQVPGSPGCIWIPARGICGWFRAMLGSWMFGRIQAPQAARPFD